MLNDSKIGQLNSERPLHQTAVSRYKTLGFFALVLLRETFLFRSLVGGLENNSLLLRRWYEIMALYYVESILTEISASRQERRVLQKSKIIRIKFLGIWGMLQTPRYGAFR